VIQPCLLQETKTERTRKERCLLIFNEVETYTDGAGDSTFQADSKRRSTKTELGKGGRASGTTEDLKGGVTSPRITSETYNTLLSVQRVGIQNI